MSGIDAILRENIRIMAQVITEVCQRSTRKQVCADPLSRNQFYILKILATSGAFLISELAAILDISPAAASKNIERLEQLGLVGRQLRPDDRRSHEIRILEPGRQIVAKFDQVTAQKQAPLLAQFTEEEKILLLDLLRRIVRFTVAADQKTDLICLQCGGHCGDDCVVNSSRGPCSLPDNA